MTKGRECLTVKENIDTNNTKPVRGFATVELFNDRGKKIFETKSENTVTYIETNRMRWNQRRDFYSGHPNIALDEPACSLNNIILDSSTDTTVYANPPLLRNIGNIIGWASKEPYSGLDAFRGTVNAAESYANSERAHWVFDFPTYTANGSFQTIMWGNVDNDMHTVTVLDSIQIEQGRIFGLTWDGSCFWVCLPDSRALSRIDPNTKMVVHSVPCPADYLYGLTWDGTNLWGTGGISHEIYKINPNTGQFIKAFWTPFANFGIAWDGSALWVSGDMSPMIFKINPNDGTVIESFETKTYQASLVYENGNLWASEIAGPTYRINLSTKRITASVALDSYGISYVNGFLWCSRYIPNAPNFIQKLDTTESVVTRLPSPITKTNANTMKVKYDFVFQD